MYFCVFVDLQRDITNMYKEPPPGLHIAADEDDITKVCYQMWEGDTCIKMKEKMAIRVGGGLFEEGD